MTVEYPTTLTYRALSGMARLDRAIRINILA
jgi:hypothetical protein